MEAVLLVKCKKFRVSIKFCIPKSIRYPKFLRLDLLYGSLQRSKTYQSELQILYMKFCSDPQSSDLRQDYESNPSDFESLQFFIVGT